MLAIHPESLRNRTWIHELASVVSSVFFNFKQVQVSFDNTEEDKNKNMETKPKSFCFFVVVAIVFNMDLVSQTLFLESHNSSVSRFELTSTC